MQSTVREELESFERELSSVIARFLRLYERVEAEARPERTPPAPVRRPPTPMPPGYA